jgi:hypothetical protein
LHILSIASRHACAGTNLPDNTYKNTNRPDRGWQLQLGRTCAGVKVMCSAPFTVLAMLAIVEMSPEHRNATADTAAIWPSRLSHPAGVRAINMMGFKHML